MSDPFSKLFADWRYPAPYSMFHDKPSRMPGSLIGPLGFPNQLRVGDPKPEGEVRIFVIGNSAVRGPASEFSIATQLEGFLGSPARVYNFGIESANTWQGLMLLVKTLADLEPDIVVVYDGVTDLIVPLSYDPRPGYTYNHYMLELIHEAVGTGKLAEFDLMRAELSRRTDLRREVQYDSASWTEAIIDAYIGAIRRYCFVCQGFGIRFLHVFQAVLGHKDRLVGVEVGFKPVAARYAELFDAAATRRLGLEDQFPDRDRVRFGNASALFRERPEECFTDYVHLQDRMQTVPARYLASLLRDWI
ncbi:SGNH/GDSL hydrolase family protein [Reyranella sp.]|uniref:SGNH/GDSL hydrolase family protein n=1 Tax=Reyranella sp. TaxID=1929291 RepID=UPI003BAA3FBE